MSTALTEPMTEAERMDMLRLIERRKKELHDKRQLVEGMSNADARKLGPTLSTQVEPATLLKSVMAAMSEAQAAAIQKPAVAPTDLEPGKQTGAAAAVDSGTHYSRALKKVLGPLSARSGTVDIIISPKVVDRFEKSCQCDALPVESTAPASAVTPTTEIPRGGGAKVSAEEIKKKPVSFVADVSVPSQKQSIEKLPELAPAPLTEAEKKKLIYSSGFSTFFQKATRMVERALGETELFDVFADYSQLRSGADQGEAERLRCLETYTDSRWSPNRASLDIRTHPKFNELFLVCYAQKADATVQDPDGCALMWNISMPRRAEYIFSCQSQVCTAQFDTYRPNHVIGGTFTGSVVLWDTRAKTRPVQRTPLSPKSHHHPIYSMRLVGTEHAHNLVTVDLDGRLCLWSMSMLAHPTETVELKKSGKDICCMCIDFADGENNSFLGGIEDGSLFQAQIHGSKAGIIESYAGHTAPVTSLHWHPNEGKSGMMADDGLLMDYCDLLLSSSLDWSVKLWSPRSHSAPLHSFHATDDYCMDVEWHPQHPAIFASGHADGELNIWDISKDIEVPYVTQSVGDSALTRLKWSNDGCRLMTGCSNGTVKMWGVSNEISQARQEDRSRLAASVEELKATAQVQRAE